ncbi:MAG: PilZ domain-containing protein [Candidatus Omnitrophica bacterium]|nr:PilZ domain-containing protein [Candidatus Omnitrophota bacterium]
MPTQGESGQERREYLRLDTVFPVQFRLESHDGKTFFTNWLQGFTCDIGRGGICLSVNNFSPEQAGLLKGEKARIALEIEMPFAKRPVRARGAVAWVREVTGEPNKYRIGLKYEQIDIEQNRQIMRYAWTKKLFIPVALGAIILLGISLALGLYFNMKLEEGNRALVENLVRVSRDAGIARERLSQISVEREGLSLKIKTLAERIRMTQEEKSALSEKERLEGRETEKLRKSKETKKIAELDTLVTRLNNEKTELLGKLESLKSREKTISEEAIALTKEKTTLEKVNFQKLYDWLKVHQNPRTGLVMSFEGDGDVSGWAFTYDQSLVAQAFTYFGDLDRAKKILDYYADHATRQRGLFLNAYYVTDGTSAEYTAHIGPNIWLGIALMQYMNKARTNEYLGLAEDLAQNIIALQDKDGGLRGGYDVEWYSTEHNLDAYAYFNMLYQVTRKEAYARARDRILDWLKQHTYDKTGLPVKRGKGDSTIATDTYAWSIAALGAAKLKEIGMDPDNIIEFAEQNCAVSVVYDRPGMGPVRIKGFDFAAQRNLARGGVVSSEWTAQMVMSFKLMSDYHAARGEKEKSLLYSRKADEYLSGLEHMIISSPSPSGQGGNCLPYATEEYIDTGHGWMTPKGKSTGSLAGTTYTIFAFFGYNPLELKD